MDEVDQEKTSFLTSQGLFCNKVMPFGLKNAGATYQRLINQMFCPQEHQLLSFIDAFLGYNQIKMEEVDQEKTSFLTSQGLFCNKVMPFGLKNAGATYQGLINQMFCPQEHQLLSFIDAFLGYNQIKMDEVDQEKTSFLTSQGLFCNKVMPFGLKNARTTYQRLINQMFRLQIVQNVKVYVDDMLVKSAKETLHLNDL